MGRYVMASFGMCPCYATLFSFLYFGMKNCPAFLMLLDDSGRPLSYINIKLTNKNKMATAKKQCYVGFLSYRGLLSLQLPSFNQSPGFTNDYEFGIVELISVENIPLLTFL